jgi:mannose-6-phosphate isomerase class I
VAQHFKIHKDLQADELAKLEEFARKPGRTIDECKHWLEAQGFIVSRSAVARWKDAFDQEDGFKASAELARGLMDVAAAGKGATDLIEAANLKLGQVVFEQLGKMHASGEVDAMEVRALSTAMRNSLATTHGVEQVRREMKANEEKAMAEAEKAAKQGASGEAVARKMRELLGLT